MNQLQIFNNPDFGQVRTIEKEGNILFAASDVAKALGYSNPRDAIAKHCKPSHVAICGVGVLTGEKADGTPAFQTVQMKFIDTGNVYRLIARSKLPEAVKFESWVFDDLIPNTLKNGGYLIIKKEDTPETLAERGQQVLQASVERLAMENEQLRIENKQKDELLEELTPKVEYFNKALDADTLYSATQLAKSLRMEAADLNRRLHKFGIQYRRCGTWFLYANYVHFGLAEVRPTYFTKANGKSSGRPTLMWTEEGRKFVFDLIRSGKLNN